MISHNLELYETVIYLFFENSHVMFIMMQENEVTHVLTRVAPFLSSSQTYVDENYLVLLI